MADSHCDLTVCHQCQKITTHPGVHVYFPRSVLRNITIPKRVQTNVRIGIVGFGDWLRHSVFLRSSLIMIHATWRVLRARRQPMHTIYKPNFFNIIRRLAYTSFSVPYYGYGETSSPLTSPPRSLKKTTARSLVSTPTKRRTHHHYHYYIIILTTNFEYDWRQLGNNTAV